MQNKPLISILIVAYNPGEYLRKTLESCLAQTYENTEILLLDNASTENIEKRITELQNYRITERTENGNAICFTICETVNLGNCKSVKLTKSTTNLGPYNGLNLLLEQAQGAYIAIQDHDDIWHSEKLEKQVDFLENNPQYIGCGTKTVMYYEGDGKYFEYYLEKTNFFTIHPSLLFRYDGRFRYDTSTTEYMCDAYSLKYNLCGGEKKIYNLDDSLTLHLIKKTSGNYSYRWYTFNITNIKRTYSIHSFRLATLITGWEIKRKIVYPVLNILRLGKWINPIERIPFRMMGKQIKTTQGDEWWNELLGK